MPSTKRASATSAKYHVQDDVHHLIGQIIDHRLRVINLHHVSPHQWLYQVEPPSVGKTRRALKVLGDPFGREPGSYYRLKTSYERLKRVESPHIERAYECGLLHDLTPYILVSWEPHVSLYEHLRMSRKPLAWREAEPMLIDLCEGLVTLHKAGIAHGDIRAQHVLLRDPPLQPLLIDACVNSAFGAPPSPGLEKGWAYWAPERTNLSTATAASDMYSFGVLMYLCLHHQLPFSPLHDTQYAKSLKRGEVLSPARWLAEAHLSVSPRPCSPRLPRDVKLLIERLLSKSPRSRPTAVEVLSILRGETPNVDHALPPAVDSKDSSPQLEFAARSVNTGGTHDVEAPREAGEEESLNRDAQRSEVLRESITVHPDVGRDAAMNYTRLILIAALSGVCVICGVLLGRMG